MIRFCQNLLTASIHGSVVILAVMLLRLLLKKTPRKYICFLWMLAGIRLLMPISVQSAFSLQPTSIRLPAISSRLVWIVWGCVASLIVAVSLLSYLRLQSRSRGLSKYGAVMNPTRLKPLLCWASSSRRFTSPAA